MPTEEIALEDVDNLPIALRVVAGSEVHNINYGDSSDRDEMAIYVPSIEQALGMYDTVDIYRYRTANERKTSDRGYSPKSKKDDLDLNIYEIRHWARLAMSGNPQILTPLFVDEEWIVSMNDIGAQARNNRDKFLSKKLVYKYIGYMQSQYEKMVGIRPNGVNRHELIEAHGFDTKFSAHMIRLAIQALSVAKGLEVEIPINDIDAARIRDIRAGKLTMSETVEWYLDLRAQVDAFVDKGLDLPDEADYNWVNGWVIDAVRGV